MKIYLEESLNGLCAKNYELYLYMDEEQVADNFEFVDIDSEGNEYIDTSNLQEKDFYDKDYLKEVVNEFDIDLDLLLDMLSWESPETLAIYLEENSEEFE